MIEVEQDCREHPCLTIVNVETGTVHSLQKTPSDEYGASPEKNSEGNLQVAFEDESDDDAPKKRKRRVQQFSDSDSDKDNNAKSDIKIYKPQDSDSDIPIFNSGPQKSRIRSASISSIDSDSLKVAPAVNFGNSNDLVAALKSPQDSDSDSDQTIFKSIYRKSHVQKAKNSSDSDSSKFDQGSKNEKQQTRVKNKRSILKNKFKSLISSREKDQKDVEKETSHHSNHSSDSEASNNESSIEKIKQIIKEGIYKSSICDPDTSDEEINQQIPRNKQAVKIQKKDRRSTKLISPKPQRMSAKQAMENMQKIKSESNRMLREKEVSLPYHKPKALSLKDIMSRRKLALSSDGKTLPIKMNGEQLKQYAQILEERQKQMMELLQSDSDEEENDKNKSDGELKSCAKTVDSDNPENEISAENSVEQRKQTELASNEADKVVDANVTAKENDDLFDVLSQSIADESTPNDTAIESKNKEEKMAESGNEVTEEQDSETNMKLVFNDSETSITGVKLNDADNIIDFEEETSNLVVENYEAESHFSVKSQVHENSELNNTENIKNDTEAESQLISLRYGSEKIDALYIEPLDYVFENVATEADLLPKKCDEKTVVNNIDQNKENEEAMGVDDFSDDEMNMEDIDNIIENADIIRDIEDKANSQVLIRDMPLKAKPKLTGAPGMVIDLDDSKTLPKQSGVELLKERFTFFVKLKTSEEFERQKEKSIKPGTQHLKLKQALEEQMAEQRSLEWAKRIEEDKHQQNDLKKLQGEYSDDGNDIEKIEAKLDENDEKVLRESESEEELIENDIEMKDKPRVKNSMLVDEAEESDCDDNESNSNDENEEDLGHNEDENETTVDINDDDENGESSDNSESSESEEEQPSSKKKGRILKAFEDSDDEDATDKNLLKTKEDAETKSDVGSADLLDSQPTSQDDVLTLAQRNKSISEDLFTSQGSTLPASQNYKSQVASECLENNDVDLGTQTFSILDSSKNTTLEGLNCSNKFSAMCDTQHYNADLDAVSAMCSGSFSQSLIQMPTIQISQSQPIGEDVLELCTGKFYDSEFVPLVEDNGQMPLGASQEFDGCEDASQKTVLSTETQASLDVNNKVIDAIKVTDEDIEAIVIGEKKANTNPLQKERPSSKIIVDDNLKSILDELDDPEFDTPKPNKFFCGTKKQVDKENLQIEKDVIIESQVKKKFIIESDDESSDAKTESKKKKKLKKKPEKRALQISDDDDEESEQDLEEAYESDIEEDAAERVVEYDSEENEIEVKPQQKASKKRGKGTEFFEQEAELTSEDEWIGSGDEDEAGLDRMEREAGDDDTFHQGRLQRELGQIHMRDVLDQDKREVRIIQELLFEDGDLGGGGRQRKFKWRNLDGEDDASALPEELRDTQEDEFESEEQWRKQRHERETFLRQMQNNDDLDDSLNASISRTTIMKANLSAKNVSIVLEENNPKPKMPDASVEKNTAKDIPSPKKPFTLLQQSYQGSILNRGRGALARLAALATPLAVDDDAPKVGSLAPSSKRNFVFAALTPEAPKVTKRKAEVNPSTPKLVKKMKTEETQTLPRSSLLDHI